MEHVTKAVVREARSSKFYNAVETEGHSFVMDEPEFMSGTDLGPAPVAKWPRRQRPRWCHDRQ